ncbi:MAG: succinylglutamate desuccinylase/aspartoacylase family protein [Thermoanaerobaculia bacterium]
MSRAELVVGGHGVEPGARAELELPVARLPSGAWVHMPVTVLRGQEAGPVLLVDAAVHGDEVNGVEILRRVLLQVRPEELTGDLIAVPVVNLFGFLHGTRYLPDRRDLNRHFPGRADGSLASRIAHLFVEQILAPCTHCLDLHTGSLMRHNLPQVRGRLAEPETRRMAEAFAAPVMIESGEIEGSLRQTCVQRGIAVLCYEGGEPHRFAEEAVQVGTDGVLRCMRGIGLWHGTSPAVEKPSMEIRESRWLRAPRSGICRLAVAAGEQVETGQPVAWIGDLSNEEDEPLIAEEAGIVIGHSLDPLKHMGDAVVHLGLPAMS